MSTAKLHIVQPNEVFQAPQRRVNWKRRLHITGTVLWWLMWVLWQVTKMVVVVAVFTVSVMLIVMGVLAHFVQGPPQR
jgi:hypothetical protein